MKCETEQELKYLLKFYNLDKMYIYYNDYYVGYINSELLYTEGWDSPSYNKDIIQYAIKQIPDYIESIKKFKSKDIVNLTIEDYSNYKLDSEKIISGTYDELFEKISHLNNILRYCNGSYYKFKDSSIKRLFSLWNKYIPDSRSMDLYYGGGIVD